MKIFAYTYFLVENMMVLLFFHGTLKKMGKIGKTIKKFFQFFKSFNEKIIAPSYSPHKKCVNIFMKFEKEIKNGCWVRDQTHAYKSEIGHLSHSAMGQTSKSSWYSSWSSRRADSIGDIVFEILTLAYTFSACCSVLDSFGTEKARRPFFEFEGGGVFLLYSFDLF